MKLHELLEKIDDKYLSIQGVAGAICGAKAKKEHIELTIATNCATMDEVASGNFDSVLILVRIDKGAYKKAIS
ncbi:hypothetical protein [Pseudomonas sp.]|uniref:hypothetical protein n=1 Tax=Pseudomonas sp. TaxID=306 RepID=UPI002FCBC670